MITTKIDRELRYKATCLECERLIYCPLRHRIQSDTEVCANYAAEGCIKYKGPKYQRPKKLKIPKPSKVEVTINLILSLLEKKDYSPDDLAAAIKRKKSVLHFYILKMRNLGYKIETTRHSLRDYTYHLKQ